MLNLIFSLARRSRDFEPQSETNDEQTERAFTRHKNVCAVARAGLPLNDKQLAWKSNAYCESRCGILTKL